jgi:hypothetical protein
MIPVEPRELPVGLRVLLVLVLRIHVMGSDWIVVGSDRLRYIYKWDLTNYIK